MAVTLTCGQTTVLPNPQLTDNSNALHTINLRRTMTGGRITYVKKRDRKRYLWSFKLTTEKAWELRAFVQAYGSKQIVIRDWLGNKFYGWIKSNPIEFNHAEYNPSCWAETVEVTLEWEGIPIPPHPLIVVTVPANMNAGVGDNDIGGMISFVYNFSETVTVNITVGGTITFSATPPGITSIIGNGTGSVTINGTMSAINAIFALPLNINLSTSAATYTITVTASAASTPSSTIDSFDMVT